MAKATSKKQNNKADPLSKKGKEAKGPKKEKDPKQSHLYTDDNPETTLKGTGFKDAETANKTSKSKILLRYERRRSVQCTWRPSSRSLQSCQARTLGRLGI